MGAQPGERLGDFNVLYEFEQGLRRQPIPASIIRAGYYMSNWDFALDTVREQGRLDTMHPADFAIPMVAPEDLGTTAARLLTASRGEHGLHYVEGPQRYSANDVAGAFARALRRPVEVAVTPRDQWQATYRKMGFSEAAAASYTRMTAITVDTPELPDHAERGTVTLYEYIEALVARDS